MCKKSWRGLLWEEMIFWNIWRKIVSVVFVIFSCKRVVPTICTKIGTRTIRLGERWRRLSLGMEMRDVASN